MKRYRKREYRYRDHAGGCTRPSLERLHHLSKIGDLVWIRGLAWTNKHGHAQTAVIVRGTKGYCRFEGFCWGYGGTGPHGLRRLFDYFRIPKTLAVHVAHEIPSPPFKVMEFWRLEASNDYETYKFTLYDPNNPGTVLERLVCGTKLQTAEEWHQQGRQLELFAK